MVIKFVVARDCAAKRELSVDKLVERVLKAREIEVLGNQWQASDPTLTNEQIIIDWSETGPDGAERTVQKSIAELKMEYGDLQRFLGECNKCKANVASDRFSGGVCGGYGCFFLMYTPLPKSFEEALISGAKMAVATAREEPAIQFLHRIAKAKLTGASITGLRGGEEPLLEADSPLDYTYGGFLSKKTVTTDQILELLLTPVVPPEDGLLFHHFLEHSVFGVKEAGRSSHELLNQLETMSALFGAAGSMGAKVNITK